MFRKSIILICAVICCANSCEVFKNVKATIFTGSELDPQEITVQTLDDLKEAYRIEIHDQSVPKLCGIEDLKNLDTLIIQHSHILELEKGAFKNMPALRILDLSHNNIKKIPAGVFNNMNIRRLNLTLNSIAKIDTAAFDDMPQLQVIEMDHNYIKEIDPNWFKNSLKMYRLSMDNNELTEIPEDAFRNLAANSKSRDRDLDLWFTTNKIAEIHPEAFKKIGKIETLWLSYNYIENLHADTFKGVKKIHSLNIDSNKIVCLDDAVLDELRVDELNIDGNPLDCDCMRKIRKWSHKKGTEVQSARRGFSCFRNKIDDVMVAQKKYYEEKIMK